MSVTECLTKSDISGSGTGNRNKMNARDTPLKDTSGTGSAPISQEASRRHPVMGMTLDKNEISDSKHRQKSPTRKQNNFRVQEDMMFRAYDIERMAERVFIARLHGMVYEPNKCRQLCHTLAAEIMERVKTLSIKRYKLVAVVSIGSLKEHAGMQLGTRCLWDRDTDNFVSVRYTNSSLFAVALIYGLHFK